MIGKGDHTHIRKENYVSFVLLTISGYSFQTVVGEQKGMSLCFETNYLRLKLKTYNQSLFFS